MNSLGAYSDRKFGPKLGMFVGAVFFGGAVYLTSYSYSPVVYILALGIGFGVPNGFGYVPAISTSWKHFPKSKSIISGIVFCGYGMGSFVFSMVAKALVNPNNMIAEKVGDEFVFPLEVANNVPHMLRVLGVIWVLIMLVSLVFIKEIYDMEEEVASRGNRASVNLTRRTRLSSIVAEVQSDIIGHFRSSYLNHEDELEEDNVNEMDVEMLPRKPTSRNSLEYIPNCPSIGAGMKSGAFLMALYMFTISTCIVLTSA